MGVQVGEHNTQIVYSYDRQSRAGDLGRPPLVTVSGSIESPYNGLNSFYEDDAPFFFGRENASDALIARMAKLTDPAMLMVSGVSGSGKSSLLRAGTLPRIPGAGLPGYKDASMWPCLVLTPTSTPLAELAIAFGSITGVDPGVLRRSLATDPSDLRLLARQAAKTQDASADGGPPSGSRRIIRFVDQFEQLFTQCRDEPKRRAFVKALHAVATTSGATTPPALVVIGVRADYEARCAEYPELTEAVDHRFLVRGMTTRQLRMAITEPARMAGGEIDGDVVKVLMSELTRADRDGPLTAGTVQSVAGALPFLSHVLDQAWRQCSDKIVRLPAYERTGGIEGAIGHTAQQVYESLTPEQRQVARRVFTRLTLTNADGADVADGVPRVELLDQSGDRAAAQIVLESFADQRLIVLDAESVEISHETLLTSWPMLHDEWLEQSRSDRIVLGRVRSIAAEWDRQGRDPSYLYTGSLHKVALDSADRSASDTRQPRLGDIALAFLTASGKAEQRRRRWRLGLLAALTGSMMMIASVGLLAVHQARKAAEQRDTAISNQLITASKNPNLDPAAARFDSLVGWRIHPSEDARFAMLEAASRPERGVLRVPARVTSVVFSSDGKILASGSADGLVRLWDVATNREVGEPLIGQTGGVTSVGFSPDGRILVSGSADGSVRLWDVATSRQIGGPLIGHTGGVTSVAFDPVGRFVASASANGSVQLWDVVTHDPAGKPMSAHTGGVSSVAFSPDGETLAVGGEDKSVRLWDVARHELLGAPMTGSGAVYAVAFSPDGRTVTSGGRDGVRLWDVLSQKLKGDPLNGPDYPDTSITFSPDGATLASSSFDSVQLWDVATHELIGEPLTDTARGFNAVAFSPDGKTIVTGNEDNLVWTWQVEELSDPAGFLCASAGRLFSLDLWRKVVPKGPRYHALCS